MYELGHLHIFDLANQRHPHLRLEAERVRLIRRALAERARCHRFYDRTLAGLGHRLVVWGWRLQERYAAPTADSAIR